MNKLLLEQCGVQYLRDSAEIADSLDLGGVRQAILDAPERSFTPLGQVACDVLGGDVFVGIKKRSLLKPDRHLDEIAIAETLIRNDPGLAAALPLFTVGVTKGDRTLGILTEDFTEAGRYEMVENKYRVGYIVRREDLPTDLHQRTYDALNRNAYGEAFGHMSATVNGRDILIDFDEIAYTDQGEVRAIRPQVEAFRELAFIDTDNL